ncbi:MAG: DUF2288 domain-containing protein [Geobacter sp.]|nr:DUF2288 domain-containing protein [Geobacter sp.]
MASTQEELAQTEDVAEWGWLRAHLERGGLIIVSPDLVLADVGVAVAADETAVVGRWVEAQQLSKPTAEQIEVWNAEPAKRFTMLVVSPYVLIQELPEKSH